jgi:hypothetical protein
MGLKRVLKKADGQRKIPSVAKGALQMMCFYGAAEAAPLQDSDFFGGLLRERTPV